jgi:leader peptidase (prepilin peptidase)/N-methyltransferase
LATSSSARTKRSRGGLDVPPASEAAATRAAALPAAGGLARYAVAAGAAAAGAIVLARFGVGARGAIEAATACVLVVLSAVDVERRVLPNRIVLPSAALVLCAQVALFPEHWTQWVAAGLGASVLMLPLTWRGGLGMGDVKLALLLGAALGRHVLAALLAASVLMAPLAAYLFLRDGAAARRAAIPFGPFLALGAVAVMLLVGPGGF